MTVIMIMTMTMIMIMIIKTIMIIIIIIIIIIITIVIIIMLSYTIRKVDAKNIKIEQSMCSLAFKISTQDFEFCSHEIKEHIM